MPCEAQEHVLRDVIGLDARRDAATQERTQRLDETKPARIIVIRNRRVGESRHLYPIRRYIGQKDASATLGAPSGRVSFRRMRRPAAESTR